MLDTLEPLHKAVDDGANTVREMSFINAYGAELQEAWHYLKVCLI